MKPQNEGPRPDPETMAAASFALHDALYRAEVTIEDDVDLKRRVLEKALRSARARVSPVPEAPRVIPDADWRLPVDISDIRVLDLGPVGASAMVHLSATRL